MTTHREPPYSWAIERLLKRLEGEIESLNARSPKKGSKTGHTRRVCELKTRPGLGRYVRELASGGLRIDRGRVRDEERLDGKDLLSTPGPSLSAEDVALGYKQLAEVERGLRTLKHTLGLRPLYHRRAERIEAHGLLCWLALLLVRPVETETGQGRELLRDELDEIQRVNLCTKDRVLQVVSTPTETQHKILQTHETPPPKRVQAIDPRAEAA